MVAKELFYVTQNSRLLAWYAIVVSMGYLLLNTSLSEIDPDFRIIVLVYSMLGAFNASLYNNIFAFDGKAFVNYFIFPHIPKQGLISKNIANTVVSIILFIILMVFTIITTASTISLVQYLILLLVYIISNIITQAFGNLISIYYPLKVPYHQFVGLFNPYLSVLLSIVVPLVCLLVPVLGYLFWPVEEMDLIFTVGALILSIIVYALLLNVSSKKLLQNRVKIFSQLK
jgi:hypothetical protein